MARAEYYESSSDGQPCLRIPGRYRRHRLPLPARPPQDRPSGECFLCHPEEDTHHRGNFGPGDELAVVGNAFPVGDAALILAPRGASCHELTPADLPREVLAAFLMAALGVEFREQYALSGLECVAFLNVGTHAAQSRRHPHLQVVGFRPARKVRRGGDPRRLQEELDTAGKEGRELRFAGPLPGRLVIPRWPAMTAEIWLPRPDAARRSARTTPGRTACPPWRAPASAPSAVATTWCSSASPIWCV